jgi:diadenosine tetraphosphatase ApaH/serine/threonine PP2A family protein phosphatase
MRYLVLSDLHANLEALEAVLDDAKGRPWERCLVLGDLVGYGADPDAVLDRVREMQPAQVIRGNHVICHGSPVNEETYILDHEAADEAFENVVFRFCLFGHTHYPLTIGRGNGDLVVEVPSGEEGGTVALDEDERYLINPGSIGQPRDGNFRPCYLILDTEIPAAEFFRVDYAVDAAMAKIADAGLPAPLALRLSRGV